MSLLAIIYCSSTICYFIEIRFVTDLVIMLLAIFTLHYFCNERASFAKLLNPRSMNIAISQLHKKNSIKITALDICFTFDTITDSQILNYVVYLASKSGGYSTLRVTDQTAIKSNKRSIIEQRNRPGYSNDHCIPRVPH